jgi:predicted RNA binding protein YcfA (HicA-like mRNA interferase family)
MHSKDVIRRLEAAGWVLHHVKGSHYQFKHPTRRGKVTVPHPKKDLPVGTLRSIFRQVGWQWDR